MTLQKAKENHDDDNEQTERRFSVSAFTSCHAETQRERGRRERIARQEHRHHPPPSQHQLCFVLHILYIKYNHWLVCTLQVVFSTKQGDYTSTLCTIVQHNNEQSARWSPMGTSW